MTEPLDAIPAEMVEAAAKALHEHDRLEFTGEKPWERLDESDRDSYRKSMAAALAAALSVGEVERWIEYGHWSANKSYVWSCGPAAEDRHGDHCIYPTTHVMAVTQLILADGTRVQIAAPWREIPQ
jgi:hypothetical protein